MEPYFRFIQPPRYFSHFNLSSLYSYKFFSFTKNRFKWPTRLLGLRPHCKIPYITSVLRESNQILDSAFDAVDSGFHVLDANFCQWNVNFRCQSLSEGLLIRILKEKKFPDFPFRKQKSPGFWNPDFLILDDVFLHRFTWEEEKCGIEFGREERDISDMKTENIFWNTSC